MTSPYSSGACAELSPEELDAAFYYPGPLKLPEVPARYIQTQWDLAKETCIECPVFLRCRDGHWGEDYGVYGGTDQYERYLYRRRLLRRLEAMDPRERAELARSMYARRGSSGWRVDAIARETGYKPGLIEELVQEHAALLKAQREAATRAARESVGWTEGKKSGVQEKADRGEPAAA